jgi:5-methylcytosine-specific restriction endonuclease McrA
VVDHVKPHRLGEALASGDEATIEAARALFWDRKNWQGLCKLCHDSVKQAQEKSGMVRGCGLDGVPIDGNHHWNRGR